ncbi:MAG TPA: hypothetical protein VGM98_21815, partial [Schlesneria sp.]
MHTFFHGWRRKAGCFMLVMACVVFVAWTRSMIITHTLSIHSGKQRHRLVSYRGFAWWESMNVTAAPQWRWISYRIQYDEDVGSWTQIVRFDRTGSASVMIVAHWPFVAALTLLSAYLILWKP